MESKGRASAEPGRGAEFPAAEWETLAAIPAPVARPNGILSGFRRVSAGTIAALQGGVVTPLRMKLAALSLVTAIIAMTGGAVFAQAVHPVCVAQQHDCGTTPRVSNCCCDDQDASWTDSAPVQSRVEVRADTTAMPALPNVISIAPAPQRLHPAQTSPPRLCLLDLPTLFVTFLI